MTTENSPIEKRHRAARIVKVIAFLIPAFAGFVVAVLVLHNAKPFDDNRDYFTWVLSAVLLSIIASFIVSMLIQRILPLTRLYESASNFDEEIHDRFRTTLRAGNPKKMLKTGRVQLSTQEQFEHVLALLHRINGHDRLTRGHSERVRAYSVLIGRELGFDEDRLKSLSFSALLHDVGKLDVPPSILSTPVKPTTAQWAVLKRHPLNSRKYVEPLETWLGPEVLHGPLAHHERWDGTGYPRGFLGVDIPLFGRIIAIADAFDVMTHPRSYRDTISLSEAREVLQQGAGSHFDPELVAVFIGIGDADLGAIRGWSTSVAGIGVAAESNLVAVGAQTAAVVGSVAIGVVVADIPPPTVAPPPVIAFEAVTTTTTTTTAAPATPSTNPRPTTTTTTIATTTTTTTAKPIELLSIAYQIKTIEVDGIETTVSADTLQVFVDNIPNHVIALEDGQRALSVIIDATDLAPGAHNVRFDLFDNGELVSSESLPIFR
ncbi:MAG: HD-GYP domain-containing protein [Acidimicrobiales bacterium]|nr:HD-GYP domain-containing protein [Acidimicrobiia bacterium]NNC80127.1 HD-GYP domain-containing protein [Acidimicrobiales bacterium]RZV48509.1 MAG: HD-GYP domain-containing protein [Acidimicrobiales bacterium]